jgi:broad specificity phosphatase PhoE
MFRVTTFLLVRHGAHDLLDRFLAGRAIDIALNTTGQQQAHRLARQFRNRCIARVLSSPRRRARETAEQIATMLRIQIEIASEIDEHDSGSWGGKSFAMLDGDQRWREWNARRGSCRPSNGESMAELQIRIVAYLRQLSRNHPDDTIVLVTHGEPIRAALLYCRGIPLDDFMSVAVPVASVAELSFSTTGSSDISPRVVQAPGAA